MAQKDIFQLKIALNNLEPPIWRRLLVEKETTFYELHFIIQDAFEWQDEHLYEFKIKNKRIGEPEDSSLIFFNDEEQVIDGDSVSLASEIIRPKTKFEYEYDFGDSWVHQIEVEQFLERDKKLTYPICIAGEMQGPPEDSGGPWRYKEKLDILNDQSNPDREELLEWMGKDFDPLQFDLKKVNERLKRLAKAIKKVRK